MFSLDNFYIVNHTFCPAVKPLCFFFSFGALQANAAGIAGFHLDFYADDIRRTFPDGNAPLITNITPFNGKCFQPFFTMLKV